MNGIDRGCRWAGKKPLRTHWNFFLHEKKRKAGPFISLCPQYIPLHQLGVDRARESGDTVAIYFLRDTLYACLHPLVIAVTALQE
jgi:hypothetical protein